MKKSFILTIIHLLCSEVKTGFSLDDDQKVVIMKAKLQFDPS